MRALRGAPFFPLRPHSAAAARASARAAGDKSSYAENRNRQINTRGDDELDAGGGRARQEGELREAGGELRNAGGEAA